MMPAGEGNEKRRHRVMRVFVLVEPKFFARPEVFPDLMEGFATWRDAHRERMEAFEFFAGGGGGFGIFNVPDEATLNRIMVEYPLTPYSEVTVRPILDGDTALGQWQEIMREMMDAAGPAV
jgi:muconolactone delta-isomerase